MNHIIVNFQPFVLEQNVMVYIDGACVYQTNTEIEKIHKVVKSLCNTYKISTVDLCGNKEYLSLFKEKMINEYSNINVNIIEN